MAAAEVQQRSAAKGNIASSAMSVDGTPGTSIAGDMETYSIFYTASRMNVTLHLGDANAAAQYYLESKPTNIRKPQFYLRKGGTKTSPTIGAIKVQWTSKHMLIARGDYERKEGEVTWDQLSREKNFMQSSDYQMSVTETDKLKTEIRWRKDTAKAVATIYDCVDENGNVVARLRSGGALNWSKGGEIELSSSISDALKEWLLLSGLGIWVWEALDYRSLRQGFGGKQDEKVQ